jgi:hypothetical protein
LRRLEMKRSLITGAVCAGVLGILLSTREGFGAEERGFLGVLLAPVPEAVAIHAKVDGGAMVENVLQGSPAEKAGIQRNDIITAINGEKVSGPDAARRRIQSSKRGEGLAFEVRRGAETLKLEVTLGGVEAVEPLPEEEAKDRTVKEEGEAKRGFLGVGFAEVPAALADHLDIEEGTGVLVGNVWKDSPAQKAGIARNDVIVSLDGKPVGDARDFARHLEEKKEGDVVKVALFHKAKKAEVEVTLGARPPELRRPGRGWFLDRPRLYGPGARSGRVIIEPRDGERHSIRIPDGIWEDEELLRELQDKVGKFHEFSNPDEWTGRLKGLLDELESNLGAADDGDVVNRVESHNEIMRVVVGDYDITIRDHDGERTVTVKQGDKVHAENMPFKDIQELDAEVRERVEKAAAKMGEARQIQIPRGTIKA